MKIKNLVLLATILTASLGFSQTLTQQSGTDLGAAQLVAQTQSSATTLTITPPAGQSVYVTGVEIQNCAGSSAVTAANPTSVTTTGFAGTTPKWLIGSGVAAGLCQPSVTGPLAKPIKSATPGTAVTFVTPTFATNQTLGLNVYYYFAP